MDDVAWVDGTWLARSSAGVPLGDAGFVLGATVTEQVRTFHGRPFLLDQHLDRLAESLAVVGLRPRMTLRQIADAAEQLALRNHTVARGRSPRDEVGPDLGVVIFVTAGDLAAQHGGHGGPPRTMIHSFPLAFALWADAYQRGLALRNVSVRQVPEACWPVRAKVRSRLHYFLADREAHAAEAGARAVLAHQDGRISETSTANLVLVVGGDLVAPPPADALPGVSLAHAKRLAEAEGLAWQERSLSSADLAAADEILLTSTPSCILPATRLDGQPVGDGRPGPVYRRLLAAWSRQVGLDIAQQARQHARGQAAGSGGPGAATQVAP